MNSNCQDAVGHSYLGMYVGANDWAAIEPRDTPSMTRAAMRHIASRSVSHQIFPFRYLFGTSEGNICDSATPCKASLAVMVASKPVRQPCSMAEGDHCFAVALHVPSRGSTAISNSMLGEFKLMTGSKLWSRQLMPSSTGTPEMSRQASRPACALIQPFCMRSDHDWAEEL